MGVCLFQVVGVVIVLGDVDCVDVCCLCYCYVEVGVVDYCGFFGCCVCFVYCGKQYCGVGFGWMVICSLQCDEVIGDVVCCQDMCEVVIGFVGCDVQCLVVIDQCFQDFGDFVEQWFFGQFVVDLYCMECVFIVCCQ